MNKKLLELATEAGLYVDFNGKPWPRNMNGEDIEGAYAKFAELLIKDCISTVEGMEPGYKDYRDQIEDAFRRDCVAEIKHKFGIEQ